MIENNPNVQKRPLPVPSVINAHIHDIKNVLNNISNEDSDLILPLRNFYDACENKNEQRRLGREEAFKLTKILLSASEKKESTDFNLIENLKQNIDFHRVEEACVLLFRFNMLSQNIFDVICMHPDFNPQFCLMFDLLNEADVYNENLFLNMCGHFAQFMLTHNVSVDPIADILLWASVTDLQEFIKLLLNHPEVDPTSEDYLAIKLACTNGHTEIVKQLLSDERVFTTNNYNDLLNDLLQIACNYGHIEIVKFLATLFDVNSKNLNDIIMHYTGESLLEENLEDTMRPKQAKIFGMAAFEKFGLFHMANSSDNTAIYGMIKEVSDTIINKSFECVLEETKALQNKTYTV